MQAMYYTTRRVTETGLIFWQGRQFLAVGRRPGDTVRIPRGGPDDLGFPPAEVAGQARPFQS